MVYFGPELKVPGDLIGLAHLAVIPEKRTLYARRTHTTTQAFQHSGRPTVYSEVLKYPL